jgi:PilZ domain
MGLQLRRADAQLRSFKRRIQREHVNIPVVLTLHGQGFRGWLNDVSEDGVGVISAAVLCVADEISVTITLPGLPDPMTLPAVVRHSQGFHHGCQFADAATARGHLRQFLSATSTMSHMS